MLAFSGVARTVRLSLPTTTLSLFSRAPWSSTSGRLLWSKESWLSFLHDRVLHFRVPPFRSRIFSLNQSTARQLTLVLAAELGGGCCSEQPELSHIKPAGRMDDRAAAGLRRMVPNGGRRAARHQHDAGRAVRRGEVDLPSSMLHPFGVKCWAFFLTIT
jgi:hypothetical protein